MPIQPRGPSRHSARTALDRQLTLGECIAIERYGRHFLDDKGLTPPISRFLEFIDVMEVCTTCGWTRTEHETDLETRSLLSCCAQHSREL